MEDFQMEGGEGDASWRNVDVGRRSLPQQDDDYVSKANAAAVPKYLSKDKTYNQIIFCSIRALKLLPLQYLMINPSSTQ
jgi:hypothetical protein